jgi:hypothetical protein
MGNKKDNGLLLLEASPKAFACFGSVLQQGVGVPFKPGCSLTALLTEQLGVDPDYIDNRIKTAFLNGRPVDDYDTAIVSDKAVLALSAAMPGLVGATFRSGGILSVFRSGISFQNTDDAVQVKTQGAITLKLFNLLVREMGPGILERGVQVALSILEEAVKKISLSDVAQKIEQNGKKLTPKQFETFLEQNRTTTINLRVKLK